MVRMKNMQVFISELNIPLENADSMVMKVTANQYKDTREKTFGLTFFRQTIVMALSNNSKLSFCQYIYVMFKNECEEGNQWARQG